MREERGMWWDSHVSPQVGYDGKTAQSGERCLGKWFPHGRLPAGEAGSRTKEQRGLCAPWWVNDASGPLLERFF